MNPQKVAKKPLASPIPKWELIPPKIYIYETNIRKNENPNLTSILIKEHLHVHYQNRLKIFNDGSVL